VRGAPAIVERSQLDEIVYERSREMFTKVRQHLRSRGLLDQLVRGVVLTGGASTLGNQVELAETVLQVPCRIGQPDAVNVLPQAANTPAYTAAVGVVRHAFEYRAALRAGRIEGRARPTGFRYITGFFKKYFF
jgi:cell division protein FtsA